MYKFAQLLSNVGFIARLLTKSMIIMIVKITTLFALLTIAGTSPVPFSDNFECVYAYTGKMTLSPNSLPFRSIYIIRAELHISPFIDGLWITLKNVTYELYSGADDNNESEKVAIPEDSGSINIPFIYHRYKNESQYGITVHKEDKSWSKNMKQGIANFIFLNSWAFNATEPAEFVDGNQFSYYVMPEENGILVEKFKTHEYYGTALEPKFKLHKEQGHVLPMLKRQTYDFNVDEDSTLLMNSRLTTTLDFFPLNGNSEKYYTTVDQHIVIRDVIPPSEHKFNRHNMEYIEIDFEPKMFRTGNGVYDFSMEKNPVDLDALTGSIKSDLEQLVKHSQESQITLSKFYLENKHSVDLLIQRLRNLDTAHLSKLYSSISNLSDDKMVNVLLQAMSLTGTPNTYIFIMDLISESKLSEDVTVKLLENMPKHVTQYYPKLVKRMWNLIEDKSTSKNVHNTAVLSMSLILYWAKCEDKITETLIERLTKAKDDEERILFINALRNIHCATSDMALLNITKDKSTIPYVRAVAMMSLKTDAHYGFLWMTLFNKTENFEVRVMALHLLTDPRYPSHYDKIYSYLLSERDQELRHFFMKKCESLSTTTIESYQETKARTKTYLPNIKWHKKGVFMSSSYLFDYVDSDYGFGAAALITYYGDLSTHNFTSVHVQLLEKSINPIWSQDEYYLHIRWTSDKPKKFGTIRDIFRGDFEGCVFDSLSIRDHDVTSYTSFKGHKDIKITDFFQRSIKSEVSSFNIDQSLNTEIVIPTDMGFPLIFFDQKSQISKIDVDIQIDSNITVNVNHRGNEIYGFSTYNPISNTWHGLRRVHTSDAYIPIDIDVGRNGKLLKLKINHGNDAFGLQSYVYNHVFMHSDNDDKSYIEATCPKCEPYTVTTEGDESIENHILWESDDEDTGLDYKLAIFDCEQRITASHSMQLMPTIQTMLDDYNKNYDSFPAVKSILALHHLWTSTILSPSAGMCGFGLMVNKSRNNPVTHIDLTVGIEGNTKFSHNNVSKLKEADMKFAYYLKNDDTLVKSWDINYLSTIDNNTEYIVKVNAKSSKPGKPDYRICLDIVDRWGHNNMTSDRTILMGNDHDGKCPKDDSKIKVSMTAGMNEELKNMSDILGSKLNICDNDQKLLISDCIRDLTSYLSYDINIEYEKLDKETMHWLIQISDFIKLTYPYEFVRAVHKKDSAKPGHVEIAVNLPYDYYNLNVSVETPIETYRYDNIEYGFLRWLQQMPYSAFIKYNNDILMYCEAGKGYVKDVEGGHKYKLIYGDDGWSELAKSCPNENGPCSWKINMKSSTDKYSYNVTLHVQVNDEVLELSYAENDLEILMNGEKMPLVSEDRYHYGEWIDYMVLRDGDKSRILINLRNIDVNIYFNYDTVKMIWPYQLLDAPYNMGQCKIDYANKNTIL
ncbi:uncharacterized protein LOC143909857 [Arctopsyche grandis]|uniref:uncharacterized protein LOC143909857 n=1 Tax=Arctopsyche grandis TaxID=121162 RepID=UPI00406D630F